MVTRWADWNQSSPLLCAWESPQLAPTLGSYAGVKPECIQRWYSGPPGFSRVMKLRHEAVGFTKLSLNCYLVMILSCKSRLMIDSHCCPLSHHVSKLRAHSSARAEHTWYLCKGWMGLVLWEAGFDSNCRVLFVQPGPRSKHNVWALEREKNTTDLRVRVSWPSRSFAAEDGLYYPCYLCPQLLFANYYCAGPGACLDEEALS